MKKNMLLRISIILLTFSLVLFNSSCGGEDDPIAGCTDPEAESYNPSAETDDGSCIYARDKFIGIYDGTFGCNILAEMGQLVQFEFNLGFTKEEILVKIHDESMIFSNFDLPGIVDGNSISLDFKLGPLPIFDVDMDGTNDNVSLTITGNVSTPDGGKTVGGTLQVKISLPDGTDVITDNCTVDGTKQ